MKIAVASKSGTEIDQHFGHAEQFLIYDYRGGGSQLAETVDVEKYCSFDPDHPFRHRQFDAIVAALKDCKAVLSVQIGQLPKDEFLKAGITPVTASGPIGPALKLAHDTVCGGSCHAGQKKSCPHR